MSATNLTKNLKLPQFVASDKPSWLGDVNGAMLKIDNGIGTIKSDITKANDTASSAKSQSDANTVTLGNVNTELESIENRVTALEAGGGTEQLEQKVKKNTDDIEALQTRADTFEDEIADNGSKISANTKSITELTPRVKSCEDGVARADLSIEALQELINSNDTAYKSRFSGTETIASNAYNQAQNNKSDIANINSRISGIEKLQIASYPITNKASLFNCTDFIGIYSPSTKQLFIPSITINATNTTVSTTIVGRFSLSPIGSSVANSTIISDDKTQSWSNVNATLSFTKSSSNDYIEITLKGNGTLSTTTFGGIVITFI